MLSLFLIFARNIDLGNNAIVDTESPTLYSDLMNVPVAGRPARGERYTIGGHNINIAKIALEDLVNGDKLEDLGDNALRSFFICVASVLRGDPHDENANVHMEGADIVGYVGDMEKRLNRDDLLGKFNALLTEAASRPEPDQEQDEAEAAL